MTEVAIVFAWILVFPALCALIGMGRGFEWWVGALMGLLGCIGVVLILFMKPRADTVWLGGRTLPPPSPLSRWAGDPTGRHELRLWDGTQWTGHVSTGGASAWDPLDQN